MANLLDAARFDLAATALITALAPDPVPVAGPDLIARLRDQQKKARAALRQQVDNFNAVYEQVAHGSASSAEIAGVAELVGHNERAALERLRPGIETLQEKLASGHELDPEIRRYFQESLEIASASLELYKTLRCRLLALSAARKPGAEANLHAHPVEGDIDHEALTRQIIARFPKILAALAK
jgi:hypothetical protein